MDDEETTFAFGMFSEEGGKLVDAVVTAASLLPDYFGIEGVTFFLRMMEEQIRQRGHAEIGDTMVRDSIIYGVFERSKGRIRLAEDIQNHYAYEDLIAMGISPGNYMRIDV